MSKKKQKYTSAPVKEIAIVDEDSLFRFADKTDAKESEKIIAPRYSYWKSVYLGEKPPEGLWKESLYEEHFANKGDLI